MAAFAYRSDLIRTARKMLAIKAISPASGGTGEARRADYLEGVLRSWGLDPRRYDYIDEYKAKRSNLVLKYGSRQKTLWILSHTDTVSEGDIGLWRTDPFKAVVKNGRIYCRGAQDNGQGVLAGMYALKSLLGKSLKYSYGLVLAADEELGSRYGVQRLLKEHIFKKGDMFVVPDWESSGGSKIEIAEKSMLWLKVTVTGKQVHASTPEKGLNAFREAAKFALEVDAYMHEHYVKRSKMFPMGSTFEMTKHEKNVDSVNIIPGKEVFYFDFRVVPDYKLSHVVADVGRIARRYAAKIDVDVMPEKQESKPTAPNAEIVRVLQSSIKRTLNADARVVGIGGGTIGAFLRNAGFDVAVWGMGDDIAHQPDEYARISDIESEIAVFSDIFL